MMTELEDDGSKSDVQNARNTFESRLSWGMPTASAYGRSSSSNTFTVRFGSITWHRMNGTPRCGRYTYVVTILVSIDLFTET